jgi:hypothetical protein
MLYSGAEMESSCSVWVRFVTFPLPPHVLQPPHALSSLPTCDEHGLKCSCIDFSIPMSVSLNHLAPDSDVRALGIATPTPLIKDSQLDTCFNALPKTWPHHAAFRLLG